MSLIIKKARLILKHEPSNSNKWQSGSCCKFIQVDENWGVKLYQIPSIREYTWNLQSIAYKNIKWNKSYKTKNFSTVIIKTGPEEEDCKNPLAPKPGEWIDSDAGYAYLTRTANTKIHVDKKLVQQLRKKMERIGLYSPSDDMEKFGNCGYLNGQAVCVDFDALSIKILIHGGVLQEHIKTPEGSNNLYCEIDEEIKQILNWKNA